MGIGLSAGMVFERWMGAVIVIGREGQQAVLARFGKYQSTQGAGFNWRLR